MNEKTIGLFIIALMILGSLPNVEGSSSGKIAIVYDVGGRGDLSFNDMVYLGALKAAKDFNLELVELQSNSEDDYYQNLETLAKQRQYLVIIAGFMMTDAVKRVAQEYPNQRFVIIDGYDPEMPTTYR